MYKLERINKLNALIKASGGKLKTRKKLHKLIYLLQEVGEDFDQDFIYHNFGVYSPTLSQDVKFAGESGIIKEEYLNDFGYIYENILEDMVVNPDEYLSSTSIKMIEQLHEEEPRLLEVLSTIVYLKKNFYEGERLKAKLKELKSQHGKFFAEAYDLAKELYGIEV